MELSKIFAFHEAGHAVALFHLLNEVPELVTLDPPQVHRASKVPREIHAQVYKGSSGESRNQLARWIEHDAMVCLAGMAVELALLDYGPDERALVKHYDYKATKRRPQGDTANAREAIAILESAPERKQKIFSELFARTKKLVVRPKVRATISRVAKALLTKGELSNDELHKLLGA